MGKMGNFTISDLKKLQDQLNKLQSGNVEAFVESCAKELAARLLAKVIKRTPVGDYSKEVEVTAKRDSKNHKKGDTYKKRINPSGKMGGTLRRGWTSKSHKEAESGTGKSSVSEGIAYADSLKINHYGGFLVIEIINPVEYASYVEYGHRTRNHKGWVPGRFMLTISEQEMQGIAPKVLEAKIKKFLGECMK
ncbi:MAG: HK97 gp10 family phage protein [Lachnospiraceae bacterium]|nr:HK97 gp10 family phage protein [Lachnospiraceae bacterium]